MTETFEDTAHATGDRTVKMTMLVGSLRTRIARHRSRSLLFLLYGGRGPSTFSGLDGFVLALQSALETTIALRSFFVTLFLLFFASCCQMGTFCVQASPPTNGCSLYKSDQLSSDQNTSGRHLPARERLLGIFAGGGR